VDVTQQADWAVLSVKDSGVGIAAEHVPHLFERFYRADSARARTDGGSGLGLALAQWITQAHGGQILVESELGRGSTFTVRLPLAQRHAERTTPSPAVATRTPGGI
jgi:signal transduction histidine kinase